MEYKDIEQLLETVISMQNKSIIKNRIDKIVLKHFRGFEDETEIDFRFPLTAVVGKNGSGKSTILRIIKLLSRGYIPQNEFFEINFDNGNLKGTEIEYSVDGKKETLVYKGKNQWAIDENGIEHIDMTMIRPKSMVGAIDKNFLYDNIGQHVNKANQVKYLIKQSQKIQQSPVNTSKKKRRYLSEGELSAVNHILQSHYSSIELIEHKMFGGTWATTALFTKESEEDGFCEYNAGSGEFLVVKIIEAIERAKNNSIVLIDEPEISLHPGAQRRLLAYMLKSIIVKKTQIVFSTHSKEMVECLPSEAIICVEKQNNDISRIKNNVLPMQAFLEIEIIPDVSQVIVEDDMACSIIREVLKAEGMDKLLNVRYIPGGASNLKKHTIPAFSKANVDKQYIWLDGDQYKKEVPDFELILEKDKDEKFYKKVFKECVGIETKNIDWCPDGNAKEGRKNKEQELQMIIQYLNYFKTNVYFMPKMIPEDIVYNENYIKTLLGVDEIPDSVKEVQNSKAKIKKWSEESGMDLQLIEKYLVYQFVKLKNDLYQEILSTLRKIIGG